MPGCWVCIIPVIFLLIGIGEHLDQIELQYIKAWSNVEVVP
jgi:hypothetical protein